MPLGDLPMVWKFVERSSAVLGVVLTAVCAYYAVATYYGWNTLAPSTPMHTEASVTPPWWLYAAIVIGLGLIATGWTMIFTRRQGKRKQQLALFFDPKDERCQRIHGPGIYTHVLAFNLTSKELKNCEVFLTKLQLSDKVGNWASVGFLQHQNLIWSKPPNPTKQDIPAGKRPELVDLFHAIPTETSSQLELQLKYFFQKWTEQHGRYRFRLEAMVDGVVVDEISLIVQWDGNCHEVPTRMERERVLTATKGTSQ
jgi:hypothetical protein